MLQNNTKSNYWPTDIDCTHSITLLYQRALQYMPGLHTVQMQNHGSKDAQSHSHTYYTLQQLSFIYNCWLFPGVLCAWFYTDLSCKEKYIENEKWKISLVWFSPWIFFDDADVIILFSAQSAATSICLWFCHFLYNVCVTECLQQNESCSPIHRPICSRTFTIP